MKITIFQINSERDKDGLSFRSIKDLRRLRSPESALIDSSIYDKVYEFELDSELVARNGLDFELERIWFNFNDDPPRDFKGRSLSVSDIIGVENMGFFFCDTVGFSGVCFEPERAGTPSPDDSARYAVRLGVDGTVERVNVGRSIELETLQQLVGGYIETVTVRSTVLGDLIMLVDEEGKLKDKETNDIATQLYALDRIAGTAILLAERGEDFEGFTDESAKALMNDICERIRPLTEEGEAL